MPKEQFIASPVVTKTSEGPNFHPYPSQDSTSSGR